MCLVQLLLVTRCSLSGSRHGCHCGSVLCCSVCVRKAFSCKPCDSEDVWGALRCPRSRNTATAARRPANYASSMQMSCREAERQKQRESTRQRHNGVHEGSVCALLSLRLLFNCHVYPATTSHVISTRCSVICVVTPLHSTTGSLLLEWHELGKLTYFMWERSWFTSFSCFLCTFKHPWGQLISDQCVSHGLQLLFNSLVSQLLHVMGYLMRQITVVFDTRITSNEKKKIIKSLDRKKCNFKSVFVNEKIDFYNWCRLKYKLLFHFFSC